MLKRYRGNALKIKKVLGKGVTEGHGVGNRRTVFYMRGTK